MDNIEIVNINGELLVDSRLIAEEMDINHKSLKDTIRKYQTDFEQFGKVAFETAPSKASDGRGSGETFYYLNEDQSYLLLTYSNNSDKTRELKIKLIKSFKNARESKIEKQVNSTDELLIKLIGMVNDLKIKTKLLESASEENKELKNKINNIETSGEKHSGSMHVIKAETKYTDDMQFVTVNSFLEGEGITIANPSKLRAIKLRAAEFYKASKHRKPLKNKKNNCIYSGADVQYIREAIFSETGIIFIDTLDLED